MCLCYHTYTIHSHTLIIICIPIYIYITYFVCCFFASFHLPLNAQPATQVTRHQTHTMCVFGVLLIICIPYLYIFLFLLRSTCLLRPSLPHKCKDTKHTHMVQDPCPKTTVRLSCLALDECLWSRKFKCGPKSDPKSPKNPGPPKTTPNPYLWR